ncbi:MADS-box transcription factor 16-like [Phalaenopsis equestris]|uniref:MADS box transcription factor n=1 Tax=Phalaenopsis equestris TaxID=78828 RepID=Q69BL2_PHAEQ|nr:MADS-box transcription factor 16-like [Phalaenopsis equestris]AAR26629.1 MADS box transcription factor [Phalaenopsis equestris]
MGRGKIEIKKIENPTNRQVTYSKRRAGIMKKASELTVLCDAQLSLVMFSSTGKFSEYCSPTTDTKSVYDRYQQVSGINLWSEQYEKMQNTLNHLKEINHNLRREIRQRMGEDLEGLEIKELRGLEQNMDEALKLVRNRKYHVISTQTDTFKKKLKNSQETHRNLLRELETEHAVYYVDDDPNNYDGALALGNGASYLYSFRTQPSQPNLQGVGYVPHDLRLA